MNELQAHASRSTNACYEPAIPSVDLRDMIMGPVRGQADADMWNKVEGELCAERGVRVLFTHGAEVNLSFAWSA